MLKSLYAKCTIRNLTSTSKPVVEQSALEKSFYARIEKSSYRIKGPDEYI